MIGRVQRARALVPIERFTISSVQAVLDDLAALARPDQLQGMARYGLEPNRRLGVRIPELRKRAKRLGQDHGLAQELWASGIPEARILASMIDAPELVSEAQMDAWVADLDSWDVCDQVCMNLFDRTDPAWEKAVEWTRREPEFEKRAGFALIACLAWHDRKAPDADFERLLPAIERGSDDPRNFVKKAVSWALRHIGKRSARLNRSAIAAARRIGRRESKAAGWVSRDVLKELTGEKVRKKLAAAPKKKRRARKKRPAKQKRRSPAK